MAAAGNEPAIDAVAQLVPATLKALHALEFAGRHLSLSSLPQLIDAMTGRDDEVNAALSISRPLDWPGRLTPLRERLHPSAQAPPPASAAQPAQPPSPPPPPPTNRTPPHTPNRAQPLPPL